MTAPESGFRLDGVRWVRDGRTVTAVDRLDLPPAGMTALVGPNGSGKTSLLRLLAGRERPTEGILAWDGGPPSPARGVHLLDQDSYLFRTTVAGNVAYGLRGGGLPEREIRDRSAAAMDRVGIAALAERPARRLSGGEARRTAIARLLVLDPAVLLLDEPTAGLDAEASGGLMDLLGRLREGIGITIATHDAARVAAACGTVYAMREGRPDAETYLNLLRGTPAADGERAGFRTAEGVFLETVGLLPGTPAVVISPADVILSRSALDSSARNRLHGTVREVVPRPAGGRLCTLDVGMPLAAVVTEASARALRLAPGEGLHVAFKATAVRPA